MIAHCAADWDWGLHGACESGLITIVNMMIAHGATYWNYGLQSACEGGYIALINLMIAYGATDWDAARNSIQTIKDYIKAQWKLHNAKAVPIIRILRRYIIRWRNAKQIQRWWHGTYPLWRELAYAPPNGIRYQQGLKRFTKKIKLL